MEGGTDLEYKWYPVAALCLSHLPNTRVNMNAGLLVIDKKKWGS